MAGWVAGCLFVAAVTSALETASAARTVILIFRGIMLSTSLRGLERRYLPMWYQTASPDLRKTIRITQCPTIDARGRRKFAQTKKTLKKNGGDDQPLIVRRREVE